MSRNVHLIQLWLSKYVKSIWGQWNIAVVALRWELVVSTCVKQKTAFSWHIPPWIMNTSDKARLFIECMSNSFRVGRCNVVQSILLFFAWFTAVPYLNVRLQVNTNWIGGSDYSVNSLNPWAIQCSSCYRVSKLDYSLALQWTKSKARHIPTMYRTGHFNVYIRLESPSQTKGPIGQFLIVSQW